MKAAVILSIVIAIGFADISYGKTFEEKGAYYDYINWYCDLGHNKAVLKVSEKLVVLNSVGVKHSSFDVQSGKEYNYKKIKVILNDATGKAIVNDKKGDLKEACGFGSYQIFNDVCHYYKDYKLSQFPYTLEYEYEVDIKSLFFWRGFTFQRNIPVKHAHIELSTPDNIKFDYKIYGIDLPMVQESQNGKTKFIWQADSIPAFDDISYAPEGFPEIGTIYFMPRYLKYGGIPLYEISWKKIGQWYYDLSANCYLKEGTVESIKTDSSSGKLAAVESLYNEIVENFRYVAVTIGIGGWKPHDAKLTIKNGYGDCKDLTTLLISRLRAIGIKSYPVLALTRGEGRLDLEFPSFNFNHVFTAAIIGSDTVWMDPTCNNCPFGELPVADENIPVLMVTDTGGVIDKSPESRPVDNSIHYSTQLTIDVDNIPIFSSRLSFTGNIARYLRSNLEHHDRDEARAFINRLLPGGEKAYIIDQYEIQNTNDIHEPLIISINVRKKKPIDALNNIIYFNPDIYELFESYGTLDVSDRTVSIDLGYPILIENDLSVTWDSSLVMDSIFLPSDDSADYDFGDMHARYELIGDTLNFHCDRSYFIYEIEEEQFEDFDAYRAKLKDVFSRYIKLYKTAR